MGKLFIIMILMISTHFLLPTVSPEFVTGEILVAHNDTNIKPFLLTTLFNVSSVMESDLHNMSEMVAKMFPNDISKDLREFENKNGFQISYKYQIVKNQEYIVKEPGFLDGLKNSCIAIFKPIPKLIVSPYRCYQMYKAQKSGEIAPYLETTFISIFTCIFSLLFMKASIAYYISFVLGCICASVLLT